MVSSEQVRKGLKLELSKNETGTKFIIWDFKNQ